MKIGIISAVPDEIKTIHSDIKFTDSEIRGIRSYYTGKYSKIDLVLVYSGVGKVSATIAATTLIEHFKVDKIIFTGLAGAVCADLDRGDIILGDKAYQHDLDGRPLCKNQFEVPFTGQGLIHLNSSDIGLAEKSIRNFLDNFSNYVDMSELNRLHVKNPDLYIGTIASGDIFVQDVKNQKNLFAEGMNTLAVEMEGAAVAQVCDDYNIPYILVRIVSDKANDSAHVSLEEFSSNLASHFASGIVQEILKSH